MIRVTIPGFLSGLAIAQAAGPEPNLLVQRAGGRLDRESWMPASRRFTVCS